jgi:hypothetical protein
MFAFNGLKGENNNCFANSSLQVLCHIPSFRSAIKTHAKAFPKAKLTNMLNELFDQMVGSPNYSLTATGVRALVAKMTGLCGGVSMECAWVFLFVLLQMY